ncbi:MAG TPA: DUF896 domain-containing protein [Firmicutes bacterium]|nr:DUF896 domain-containing protein [Bacillota bacterium]
MEEYKIKRINELAKKAREQELTPEETAERDALRREYIESVKQNLAAQLNSTIVVEPDGTRRQLRRKG